MKRLFTIAIATFLFQGVFAQSWNMNIFTKKDTSNLAGTEHHIIGDAARSEVKEDFYTVMTSDDSMLVAIKRVELNVVPNTSGYFCWQVCYASVPSQSKPVWIANDSLWVYKNDTILNFSAYYQPNMQLGNSSYRFVFYPASKPSDSTYIDLSFDMLTIGVEENSLKSVEVYPNPASDVLRVSLPSSSIDKNVFIRLSDYQGKVVLNQRLTSLSNSIDVSSHHPGVYVMQLIDEDGRVEVRKVVIE